MIKIIAIVVVVALVAFFFWNSSNNKKLAVENQAKGKAFLTANELVDGVVATASGLQHQLLAEGTGTVNPGASDRVKVHYHGTLIDGTIFDSSVNRGEPISFGLNQVIKGWTEGLQLMVVGEKRRLFIPSNLGYGNRAAGAIEPGSVLIFDVELLGINE